MKIAIVDCNAVCHAVKYSTRQLSFSGESTGVIFGFFRKMFQIQKAINADAFVFCWDSPVGYLREKIYPKYKEKDPADKSPQDIELDKIAFPQFTKLREEILPQIGFSNIFMENGFEADDLIAQIVEDYKDDNDIVILSRDGDLYQLLDEDRVVMYDFIAKKYYKEDDLVNEYGVHASSWYMIKSIAGCSGDNVEGVQGVKEKTAAKFILGKLNPTTQAYQKIIASEEMMLDNVRLVLLPFEGTPKLKLKRDNHDINSFITLCHQKGMKSLMTESDYKIYNSMFNELTIHQDLYSARDWMGYKVLEDDIPL